MAEIGNLAIDFSVQYANNIIARIAFAAVILLASYVIGKLARRLLLRMLDELEIDNILKKTGFLRLSLKDIISTLVEYIIVLIGIIFALAQLGLSMYVILLISLLIIVIIVISIVLAIKDFVPNFFAGLYLSQTRKLEVGKILEYENVTGEIVNVNMVETRIERKNGDILHIPNSLLTKAKITIKKKK